MVRRTIEAAFSPVSLVFLLIVRFLSFSYLHLSFLFVSFPFVAVSAFTLFFIFRPFFASPFGPPGRMAHASKTTSARGSSFLLLSTSLVGISAFFSFSRSPLLPCSPLVFPLFSDGQVSVHLRPLSLVYMFKRGISFFSIGSSLSSRVFLHVLR